MMPMQPGRGRTGARALGVALLGLAACSSLDLAGVLLPQPELWKAGGVAAWPLIGFGVLAAAFAGYDYLSTRPPSSAGRRAGMLHLLLTAAALALFSLARWVRGAADVPPDPVLLWSQGIALLLLAGGLFLRRQALTSSPLE
jgi:uncharacterized membrane protein